MVVFNLQEQTGKVLEKRTPNWREVITFGWREMSDPQMMRMWKNAADALAPEKAKIFASPKMREAQALRISAALWLSGAFVFHALSKELHGSGDKFKGTLQDVMIDPEVRELKRQVQVRSWNSEEPDFSNQDVILTILLENSP